MKLRCGGHRRYQGRIERWQLGAANDAHRVGNGCGLRRRLLLELQGQLPLGVLNRVHLPPVRVQIRVGVKRFGAKVARVQHLASVDGFVFLEVNWPLERLLAVLALVHALILVHKLFVTFQLFRVGGHFATNIASDRSRALANTSVSPDRFFVLHPLEAVLALDFKLLEAFGAVRELVRDEVGPLTESACANVAHVLGRCSVLGVLMRFIRLVRSESNVALFAVEALLSNRDVFQSVRGQVIGLGKGGPTFIALVDPILFRDVRVIEVKFKS